MNCISLDSVYTADDLHLEAVKEERALDIMRKIFANEREDKQHSVKKFFNGRYAYTRKLLVWNWCHEHKSQACEPVRSPRKVESRAELHPCLRRRSNGWACARICKPRRHPRSMWLWGACMEEGVHESFGRREIDTTRNFWALLNRYKLKPIRRYPEQAERKRTWETT